MSLVPLEEARRLVLDACPPLHPTAVPLTDALGLVASVDVVAEEAVPPFANSAMDGYAVRAAETPGPLRVVGSIAAGESAAGVAVGPGEAVRIMTGAPVPEGADAVVLVERTRTTGDTVEIEIGVSPGTSVRPVGDDVRPGDVVVRAGTELSAGHIGLLATIGVRRAPVRRRPRVGVLSTGDELVDGPEPLRPGQIRDSNRLTLLALAEQAGAEPVDLGLAPDDEAAITDAVTAGGSTCDAVLTSGGVSMGDYDLVKVVLDRLGSMRWMQLALRPAKPFAFGVVDGTPVFGLPGNPVSSMVSFELLARPALRRMLGHPDDRLDRVRASAVADEPLRRSPDGKLYVLRVQAALGKDGRYHVRSAGGQGSHQLSAMAAANALALVPDGDGVAAGGDVEVLLL